MTRVIAGSHKGRRLEVPARGTRPTSDKVRGAIFSRLQNWGVVEGARTLDLFAGSGALGIEAASRGARRVTLVEKSGSAAQVLRRNLAALKLSDRCKVAVRDARAYLRGSEEYFDLVFIDPPYDYPEDQLATLLTELVPRLEREATVVLERDARSPAPELPEGLEIVGSKKWGDTAAWYLEV